MIFQRFLIILKGFKTDFSMFLSVFQYFPIFDELCQFPNAFLTKTRATELANA